MSAFRSRSARKPYSRPSPRDVNSQWVHDKAPGVNDTKISINDNSRRGPSSTEAESNTKLVVSNLHYEITPKDLVAIFGRIGTLVREPMIRYDRSGRSSGTAIVFYETTEEATKAKEQFQGKLAKGQPMEIVFDTFVPRSHTRRSVSAPGQTHSLLNRIQKPALKDRLSSDDMDLDSMQVDGKDGGVGPIRSRRRGGNKPSNIANKTKPGTKQPKKQKPKTAEELDKELDAFMGDDAGAGAGVAQGGTTGGGAGTSAAGGTTTAAAEGAKEGETVAQDVEMA